MNKFNLIYLAALPLFAACGGEKPATTATSSGTSTSQKIAAFNSKNLKIVNTQPISGALPQEIANIALPIASNCNSKQYTNFNGATITRLDEASVSTSVNVPGAEGKQADLFPNVTARTTAALAASKLGSEFGKSYDPQLDVVTKLNNTIEEAKQNSQVYIFSKSTAKINYADLAVYNNEEVLRKAIAKDICANPNITNVTIIYGITDNLLAYKPKPKVVEVAKVEPPKQEMPKAEMPKAEAPREVPKPVDATKATATSTTKPKPGATTTAVDPKKPGAKEAKKSDGGLENTTIRINSIPKKDVDQ